MDCNHVDKFFNPQKVLQSLKSNKEESRFCSVCRQETDSKWICCSCGIISCGRFVKGHALEHFKTSKHTVAMDLESKAIHW